MISSLYKINFAYMIYKTNTISKELHVIEEKRE